MQNREDHNLRMVKGCPIQVFPLSKDLGGGFQALFLPLARGIVGYGATPQEAVAELQTLPEATTEKDWDEYSGKFNARVLKALHAQLLGLAEEQEVSLNSLVQTLLTSGATALAAGRMFGMTEAPKTSPPSFFIH